MRGESLAYVKEQLGHSSIQETVDLYGHLAPGINRGAVNALAEATKCNPRATELKDERERDSETVENIGGPCRGRTYGPLIKSEAKGIAQVFDDMGDPLAFPVVSSICPPSRFVPPCPRSTTFVRLFNTVLTPETPAS